MTLKKRIKLIAEKVAMKMPWNLLRKSFISQVLIRILGETAYEFVLYRQFGMHLLERKEEFYQKLKKDKRIMIIRKGKWGNT